MKVAKKGDPITLFLQSYNPAEGELREHLLDRIGVDLSVDATPLSVNERVEGVENVLGFSGGTKEQFSAKARETLDRVEEEERKLQQDISSAMTILPDVKITSPQILYLCEEATRAGCEGQRAEIFATEVAKTSAAVSQIVLDNVTPSPHSHLHSHFLVCT